MQSPYSYPARSLVCVVSALLLTAAAGRCTFAQSSPPARWTGTWATAPLTGSPSRSTPQFGGNTLRQIVHTSLAGKSLRIRFTNEFGTEPLVIDAAQVALSTGAAATQPGTSHPVTFNQQAAITIPPGAYALSDPIAFATPAFADLAISIYLPVQQISTPTIHPGSDQTSYLTPGNLADAATLPTPTEVNSWYFLKGVDVEADAPNPAAVVAYGDSITDGAYASLNANHRWPDILAQRLQTNAATRNLSVLNEAIGGNRVLHDGAGLSALARFDRDVLAQAGVKYLIILESINDIGGLARKDDPRDTVTAQDLEQGLAQLAARAHEHGIKVFGATITPYLGAGYFTPQGEQIREAVNQWIRSSNTFDGVIDFDKAVQDPATPQRFLPADEHGDHLHPNDTGYKAMGDAIDLKLFR